ncbi:uncharacterized protein [Diabrotica undecimpunctata]|uniref:uncharacterized protein n=1 Tax=Diabrotica undecimpunctata TaxID=50387 RepID=UPI003B641F03
MKFLCHRSGCFNSESKGKRHLKMKGSIKIGGFCPAGFTVVVDLAEKVEVNFIKTHIGHQTDIGQLFLSVSERQSIAEKIALRIPFSTILDEVRDSVRNSELERLHLLTKKDLYNIECAYNLNTSSGHHKVDGISVDAWVKDMEATGNVLFYKAQETTNEKYPFLKSNDFVLIIMTDAQAEIMCKYGSDCVCVDGTHGTNGYGFELNTVLVLDNLRQGFPCAFLISNRRDQEVLTVFFSAIKEKVGLISCENFMSDLADSFYNAWIQVMTLPEHRLYCTWHLDRAWRNNLYKITTKEKQVLVYKQLRIILQETDVPTFSIMLKEFQCQLENDPDLHPFLHYFKSYYANKSELWAYCYRMHTGLNTNMHIERMHRTLKYLYLNGKTVKRLDKAILAIMKFVRDKLFDSLIVLHKVYTVEENEINCKCEIFCTECGSCIHRYRCSCIDSAIKWNMCKHIHLLCRYRGLHFENQENLQVLESNSGNQPPTDISKNKVEECILTEISKKEENSTATFNNKKESIKVKFLELLDSATSIQQLEVFEKAIAPIAPTLSALTVLNFSSPASTNINVPHNKKIQMQRRLFSTKKKMKNTRTKIQKPSSEETDLLSLSLVSKQ